MKPPSTSKDSQASSAVSGIGYLALRDRSYANPRRRRPRPPSPVSEDTALLRRRYVYQYRLRCRYVGSNRLSRFRNIGPKDFLEDEELVSRARMWMRRELMVWEWTSSNAGFLIEFIIGVLKSVDLRGSAGQAEEMVAEFLGKENAQIFVSYNKELLRLLSTQLTSSSRSMKCMLFLDRHLQSYVILTTSFSMRFARYRSDKFDNKLMNLEIDPTEPHSQYSG